MLFQVPMFLYTNSRLANACHQPNKCALFKKIYIVGTKLLQMHTSKSENRNSFFKKRSEEQLLDFTAIFLFFRSEFRVEFVKDKSLLSAKSFLISHIILIFKHQAKNIRGHP